MSPQDALSPVVGTVQGIGAHPALDEFISTVESAQRTVLDWRRSDFWRSSGFAPAWEAFKRKDWEPLDIQAVVAADIRDECALSLHCCSAFPLPPWGFHSRFPGTMCALRPDTACGLPDRAAAVTRDPQTGRPVPSAAEKAASELLQARSLLLAGQAGLCCNPGCVGRVHSTSFLLQRMASLDRQLQYSTL